MLALLLKEFAQDGMRRGRIPCFVDWWRRTLCASKELSMKLGLLATLGFVPALFGQSLAGLWDATVTLNGFSVPFRMEISSQGTTARGSFFNGEDRFPSTAGRFENDKL